MGIFACYFKMECQQAKLFHTVTIQHLKKSKQQEADQDEKAEAETETETEKNSLSRLI